MGCLMVFLMVPVLVLADTGAAGTDYGGTLAEFLSAVVFPVIAAFMLGLVGVLLNLVRKKWKLDISQRQEEFIDGLVRKGLAYAEEKAAAAVKRGVRKYTGNEKADEAIAFVLSHAPHLSVVEINTKVTAWLGLTPGVGATGNQSLGYWVGDPKPEPDIEPAAEAA